MAAIHVEIGSLSLERIDANALAFDVCAVKTGFVQSFIVERKQSAIHVTTSLFFTSCDEAIKGVTKSHGLIPLYLVAVATLPRHGHNIGN